MSYFAIIRDAGPGWTDGHGTMEQPGVSDHAAFMNALADEGLGCAQARSPAPSTGAFAHCS